MFTSLRTCNRTGVTRIHQSETSRHNHRLPRAWCSLQLDCPIRVQRQDPFVVYPWSHYCSGTGSTVLWGLRSRFPLLAIWRGHRRYPQFTGAHHRTTLLHLVSITWRLLTTFSDNTSSSGAAARSASSSGLPSLSVPRMVGDVAGTGRPPEDGLTTGRCYLQWCGRPG